MCMSLCVRAHVCVCVCLWLRAHVCVRVCACASSRAASDDVVQRGGQRGRRHAVVVEDLQVEVHIHVGLQEALQVLHRHLPHRVPLLGVLGQ